MDFFKKITVAYLATVSLLSPTIYYTYQWMFSGEETVATISAVAFVLVAWVFYNTLKKIEIENKDGD